MPLVFSDVDVWYATSERSFVRGVHSRFHPCTAFCIICILSSRPCSMSYNWLWLLFYMISLWSTIYIVFDTKITMDAEGRLTTDLYTKTTDTHQYFHRDSCDPGHCKKSIPYSQALRIRRICSRMEDFLQRTQELKGISINYRYNKDEVQHQIDRTIGLDRDALLLAKKSKRPLNGSHW